MKKWLLSCALVFSGAAMAHGCPGEMKAIDAALSSTKVTGANLAKVKPLKNLALLPTDVKTSAPACQVAPDVEV